MEYLFHSPVPGTKWQKCYGDRQTSSKGKEQGAGRMNRQRLRISLMPLLRRSRAKKPKWPLQEMTLASVKVCLFSYVRLFVTLQTIARQAPLSTGFSKQEYLSGLPFPSPGDLLNPGLLHCKQIQCLSHQVTEAPGKTCWQVPPNNQCTPLLLRSAKYAGSSFQGSKSSK